MSTDQLLTQLQSLLESGKVPEALEALQELRLEFTNLKYDLELAQDEITNLQFSVSSSVYW